MNKEKIILLMIILFINPIFVSSECTENQININTASKSELQEIINIGPAYSEQIINLRKEKSFESLDDLERVSGIAENRLKQIKNQGLACVEKNNNEIKNISEKNNFLKNQEKEEKKAPSSDYNYSLSSSENNPRKNVKNITESVIKLSPVHSKKEKSKNPKVIKNPDSYNFQQNKSRYANYGLGLVIVIVASSMLIKYRKNKYKNEFRE